MKLTVRPTVFSQPLFLPLLADAEAEDCRFVGRLQREWASGIESFDRPGETLLGARLDGRLCGVGGISFDPYAPEPGLARLRHLYVRPALRNRGIGALLIRHLIDHARGHFATLRLSTQGRAAPLYERLGFVPEASFKQTHIIRF